jgi:hypothetical protein
MSIKLSNTQLTFPDGSSQSGRYDKDVDAKGTLLEIKCFPNADMLTPTTGGTFTWTRPSGCTLIKVLVVGGGGGACGYGESGGSGGYAEKWINNPPETVTVTVGSRGDGSGYYSASGNGTTSSFGSYVSATGGSGANRQYSHSGGYSGGGSGGDINLYGGGGSGHDNRGGKGGQSFFGGSKFPGWPNNSFSHYGESHYMAPGAGGSGEHTTHSRGSHGACGMVVVYSYK